VTRLDAEEERIGAAQAAMPAVANRYDHIPCAGCACAPVVGRTSSVAPWYG